MEDDFNTPQAMAILVELYRQLNANVDHKASADLVAGLRKQVLELSNVLGLAERVPAEAIEERRLLAAGRKGIDPKWVEERIAARLAARRSKDFGKADAIRAEVAGRGIELRDTPNGTDWRILL